MLFVHTTPVGVDIINILFSFFINFFKFLKVIKYILLLLDNKFILKCKLLFIKIL